MIITHLVILKVRNIAGKICRESQNAHFVFNKFLPIIITFRDDVGKYGRTNQATNYNILLHRKDVICILSN